MNKALFWDLQGTLGGEAVASIEFFVEDELIEEFGYPNQRFILHPSCL